jgi:hypothetical protein
MSACPMIVPARQKLAIHERGHRTVLRVARGFDDAQVSCEIRRDDGVTYGPNVSDPRWTIAVLLAGGVAEAINWGPDGREGYGSDEDRRMIAEVLDGLHPECRSHKLAEGERIARDALREHWDLVEGVAERLWLTDRFP